MKIYVCWDTSAKFVGRDHPCGVAYHALVDAGHDPEVIKARGWNKLPSIFNSTRGRKDVLELTGKVDVPVMVTDDGTVVAGSREIIEWAGQNAAAPAPA